jgi:hypothetical protein
MNFINNITSNLMNKDWQEFSIKTGGCTAFTAICGYAGAYFFTTHNPRIAAAYIGICTLVGLVVREIFEEIKTPVESEPIKKVITALQLLQFPLIFHMLDAGSKHLSGVAKFEIISATAYFIAIPIFFYFANRTLEDPSFENVWATVGVMLAIGSQLSYYARVFK